MKEPNDSVYHRAKRPLPEWVDKAACDTQIFQAEMKRASLRIISRNALANSLGHGLIADRLTFSIGSVARVGEARH